MPRVLNRRDVKRLTPDVAYVGRPTKWGNPFYLHDEFEREAVIGKYRTWLKAQMDEGKLDPRELTGKDLICWCAPKACHADVLLEIANAS